MYNSTREIHTLGIIHKNSSAKSSDMQLASKHKLKNKSYMVILLH